MSTLKTGRKPIAITKDMIRRAKKLASRGLSEEQIAESLAMHWTTLKNKKKQYNDLKLAIEEGRALGIAQVANALFEKALGGDTTAAIFFLKCRAPTQWNDRNGVDSENKRPVINFIMNPGEDKV